MAVHFFPLIWREASQEPTGSIFFSNSPGMKPIPSGPGGYRLPRIQRCAELSDEGQKHLTKGEYELAAKAFAAAIREYGRHWELIVPSPRPYLALSYLKLGRMDEAVVEAEQALSEKSDTAGLQEIATTVYVERGYMRRIAGDLHGALHDYNRALRLKSDLPLALQRRAYVLTLLGHCTEALRDFDAVLRDPPKDWENVLLVEQGRCYLTLGHTEEARKSAQRAIEAAPWLALNYGADNALDLFDVVKRTEAMSGDVAAARKAEQEGSLLEAFQLYDKARRWHPLGRSFGNRPPWTDYTTTDQALLNEIQTAMQRLYPRLPVKPAQSEAARRFLVQAELAFKEKRYDDAIVLFGRVLQAEPCTPEADFNIAFLSAEQGRFADAIEAMKLYLKLAPDAANARDAQDKIYEWETKVPK